MKYSHVHQLGFVVRDMQKAMAEYGAIYGVKKWYRPVNEPMGALYYKGRPFTDPGYDMAIGYCGKTEIELITSAAEENIYTTFLREHGEGLHHISFFVRNLDKYVEAYKQQGFVVTQNGVINGRSTTCRFAYLTRPGEGFGRIVEFSETRLGPFPMGGRGPFSMWLGTVTGNMTRWEGRHETV